MKTTNLISLGIMKALLVLFLILSTSTIYAQGGSIGSVTLSTQDQINSFHINNPGVTMIVGDLLVDDGGSGNITNLDPFYKDGVIVTGHITVNNCPGLIDLRGLDGINSIGGWFNISNNANLVSLGPFNFNITKLTNGFLNLNNCPKLNNLSSLNVFTQTPGVLFTGNLAFTDFSIFNNLTHCDVIQFNTTNVSKINGFNGIASTSFLNFVGNPSLTSISGFNSLTSIKVKTVLGVARNNFQIANNINLSNISAFPVLSTTTGTVVNFVNNTSLSTCCFALDLLGSSPGSVSIANNALGCNSVAQIDAPPTLTICPPHRTVSTNPGTCTGTTIAANPTALDNCDLATYNLSELSPDGNVQTTSNLVNGASKTFNNLALGLTKLTYIATDDNGNISTCFFNVTVEDNEKPVMSNIPSNVTINCNDIFPSIPSPILSDNCDASPVLTIASSVSSGNCDLGALAEIHAYTWTLTDESGNSSIANWVVSIISDFSFDLGEPIEICDASNYLIQPGTIGNSYLWSTGATSQALDVSASGTYSVTVTSNFGCCYVDEKMVTFSSPPDATAMGGTLNCSAENVQIFGSSTASGVNYTWTGPGGFISALQNPLVTSIGEYILTVSNASGCAATATTNVTGDNDIPDVTAEGGTIDCGNTSVQLMGSSATSGVSYSWTGPESFTSDMQNPTVSAPGIYTLNVLSGNGCTGRADANVEDNTAPPEILLEGATLTCAITEIELSVEGTASWTGPEGFTSTDGSITISSAGTYAVTVTGANSCTNSETIEILSDLEEPNISAEGGIINCVSGQTTISGNSTTDGATYSWSGPEEFTTEIQNPIAILAGTYTLVVTSPNGCTASQAVEVAADMDAPEVSVNDASIDCINSSATLTATSPNEGITFMWSGPNGYTSEDPIITVMEPGEYTVMAINENGCAGIASSQVDANNVDPTVSIFIAPLGCQVNEVTFITDVSEGVNTYTWSGPNDFTSNEKEPVITNVGTYTLEVSAENGCTAMTSFEVVSDSEVPNASASVEGVLTCTQNTTTLMGNTTSDTVTFSWTGPDGYASDIQNPTVSQPGEYIFKVSAANGCFAQAIVQVLGDGEFPTVSATGGDINCINNSVVLSGGTNIADATFRWEGPNGFATSISNPEVTDEGEYTFTVTTAGGCVAFKSVNVTVDRLDPDLSISEGFLNCDAGTRNFRVVTNANDPTIEWTGPDDYTSSELSATYTKAGIYNVIVTGSNGCSSQLSIEVDFDIPYIHTLNIMGNDASLEIEGGTPPFEIIWDNNISGTEVIDLPDGEHFVKIVDGLECTKFVEFNISTTNTIDIEEELGLKLYPNPVVNELKVEWKSTSFEAKSLEIISTNGNKIQRTEIAGNNSQVLNLNDLTPGIYIVKIEGKDAVVFKKFLKM